MGWDQVNRAASLSALGRYDEAKAALNEAYAIAAGPEAGFKSQLAYVDVIGAQMALSQGDRAEAAARATAALKLAEPDYKDTALQARQTLALTEASCRRAEKGGGTRRGSRGRGQGVETSPALVDRAARLGRSSHGRRRRTRARSPTRRRHRRCSPRRHSWNRNGARGWCRRGPCGSRATRTMAYDYAVRAETSRAALQARWGEDNYRGYVRRPDIQVRLKQLGQLLGAKKIVQRTVGG